MAYTPEQVAAIARQTAAKVGCEALRWWPDVGDPRWLRIEAELRLAHSQSRTIRLLAFLGLESKEGLFPTWASGLGRRPSCYDAATRDNRGKGLRWEEH